MSIFKLLVGLTGLAMTLLYVWCEYAMFVLLNVVGAHVHVVLQVQITYFVLNNSEEWASLGKNFTIQISNGFTHFPGTQ